jgi:hypothetical protein
MKDIFDVFDEKFELMQRLVNAGNYDGCLSISTNLITISVMSDYADGVFVGEILESSFGQILPEFRAFEVGEDERKAMGEKIGHQIGLIAKSYRKEDKRELYEALKNLRTAVTEFQFKCRSMMKPKLSPREQIYLGSRRP